MRGIELVERFVKEGAVGKGAPGRRDEGGDFGKLCLQAFGSEDGETEPLGRKRFCPKTERFLGEKLCLGFRRIVALEAP